MKSKEIVDLTPQERDIIQRLRELDIRARARVAEQISGYYLAEMAMRKMLAERIPPCPICRRNTPAADFRYLHPLGYEVYRIEPCIEDDRPYLRASHVGCMQSSVLVQTSEEQIVRGEMVRALLCTHCACTYPAGEEFQIDEME